MSASTNNVIYIFRGTPPDELNMRTLPGLPSLFLAFHSTPPPSDGGLSAPIRRALAEAVCTRHSVTFVGEIEGVRSGRAWHRSGNYAVRRQTRWPWRSIPLVWTRAPDIAANLFEQHWSTETQIAVLGDGAAPVAYEGIFGERWNKRTLRALLGQPACSCALLPGVDGEFAALYCRDELTLSQWQDSLQAACRTHSIDLIQARTATDFVRAGT